MAKIVYTTQGLADKIRELRTVREIIADREAFLILLYNASVDYNCPVDEDGKPFGSVDKAKLSHQTDEYLLLVQMAKKKANLRLLDKA